MRFSMEKRHFEQAKLWLAAASYVASYSSDASEKYAVGVAMLVHSVIKTNDALTYKFFKTTAHRHDDARRLFEDIIHKNLIKQEYALYAQTIQDAINAKAHAEYRGSYFSKNDFEDLRRKAEKFIGLVQTLV